MKPFQFLLLILINSHIALAQSYLDQSQLIPAPFNQKQTMDVAAADLNKDGYIDLVMANEFQANTILLGSESGAFSHSPQSAMNVINDSEDVIIADFNLDGWLDIIFCSEDDFGNGETNVHEYYLGSEDGDFEKSSFQFPDSEANAVITMDVNNDNWPDVLFGNNSQLTCMINNGDGTFENESDRFPTANRTTQDLHVFDADGDSDLDIFEGNENGNILFINDGMGNFNIAENALPTTVMETRKIASGDIDKDGDLDLMLSNVAFTTNSNKQNRLWQNNGNGIFTDITSSNLPDDDDQTLDTVFGDLDFDGDLDMIVANVFGDASRIYINENGIFTDQTMETLGTEYFLDALAVLFVDLNQDNFKDLFFADRTMGSDGSKDVLLLYDINSITKNPKESDIVNVFPNPIDSAVTINSATHYFDQIALYDQSGKEIYRQIMKKAQQNFELDLSRIESGTFLLTLYSNNRKLFTTTILKK